ncbi:HAD family hydrolase [Paludibacterium purpuratum]|uniref:Sugar-phosphatase n=1 Tax=Paludibacterium purpuratum TaxID=1144873 RepID=A0A4R7B8X3_9NEIS|nr:HAD family hydrolase [Paludibacterium purpuratum]TDR80215.1 sugar-phosphatase [Paludibacterium purpuratum]
MQWPIEMSLNARALLFDMDGTLVDSTAVVEKIWRRFAQRHGIDVDQLLANIHGRKTEDSVAAFAPPGLDVAAEAARLTAEEVADTEGVVEIAGASALLSSLPPERWALVTSAPRALAEARLAAAGLPLPAVLISGEDVTRGKPDPQGYLAAARRLGVDPADCVVFEDAPVGLQAGHAAGMQVVALATTLPTEALGQEYWLYDYRSLRIDAEHSRLRLDVGLDQARSPASATHPGQSI